MSKARLTRTAQSVQLSRPLSWLAALPALLLSWGLAAPLFAIDIYRLRLSAPASVAPGDTFDVTVLVDNDSWPASGNPDAAINAFSFGLSAPSEFVVQGFDTQGTILQQVLGTDPAFFSSIQMVSGGATIGVVLSSDLSKRIPPGLSQPLLIFQVQVPSQTAPGTYLFDLVDTLGAPPVALVLSVQNGAVVPATRGASVTVAAAAMAGPDPDLAGPVAEAFPLPTEEELTTVWLGAPPAPAMEALAGPGGSAPLLGGTSGLCDYNEAPKDLADIIVAQPSSCAATPTPPPPYDNHEVLFVNPGGPIVPNCIYGSIQAAIDRAEFLADSFDIDSIIIVEDGTYYENLTIDAENINDQELILLSRNGPENCVIDSSQGPGPCLDIAFDPTATYQSGGKIIIGWTTMDDPWRESPFDPIDPTNPPDSALNRGWRGFGIVGGTPRPTGALAGDGGGIVIRSCPVSVEIRGNYIHHNPPIPPPLPDEPIHGAGILAYQSGNLEIVLNDISDNLARDRGMGIYLEGFSSASTPPVTTKVAHCWIHDHRGIPFDTPATGRGRGVGIYAEALDLEVCDCVIYGNTGTTGIGLYYEYPASGETVCYVQGNEIRDNTSQEDIYMSLTSYDAYQGAGVALRALDVNGPRSFGFVNNVIHDNDITPPNGYNYCPPLPGGGLPAICANEPNGVGGGVYIDLDVGEPPGGGGVGDLVFEGDWDVHPNGNFFVSNAIYGNIADSAGGGVYLDIISTDPHVFRFFQNTIVENRSSLSSGSGGGLYIPDGAGSTVDARDNIVFENQASDLRNWFATCGSTASLWQNSFLPEEFFSTGACVLSEGLDIFGSSCTDTVPTENQPRLSIEGDPPYPQQEEDSPTIEAGDPDLSGQGFWGVMPYAVDPDGGERIHRILLDVGADEDEGWFFRRGDANSDGNQDITDAVWLLAQLFVPGSPPATCADAVDVNDDATVDMSDVVFLLTALFVPAAPSVPPPYDDCDRDPTADDLDCVMQGSCP